MASEAAPGIAPASHAAPAVPPSTPAESRPTVTSTAACSVPIQLSVTQTTTIHTVPPNSGAAIASPPDGPRVADADHEDEDDSDSDRDHDHDDEHGHDNEEGGHGQESSSGLGALSS